VITVYQLQTKVSNTFDEAFESDQEKKRRTVYLCKRHIRVFKAISAREGISFNEVVRRLADNIIQENVIYRCGGCGHFFFSYDVDSINQFRCRRCGNKSYRRVQADPR
jgi:DNA-directed RNA polymerase subunit RPC12/RpoP